MTHQDADRLMSGLQALDQERPVTVETYTLDEPEDRTRYRFATPIIAGVFTVQAMAMANMLGIVDYAMVALVEDDETLEINGLEGTLEDGLENA
jgi:hypothetical protein